MRELLIVLVILFLAALGWLWWRRRNQPLEIRAVDATTEAGPAKVALPAGDGEDDDRAARGRTGEDQELARKVIHGPYRPIEDRGPESHVKTGGEP